MDNNTLTLTKAERNIIIEHALNENNPKGYFMCNVLMNGIEAITRTNLTVLKLNSIIENNFPEFTRENFLKFLKKNYPDALFSAKAVAELNLSFWLESSCSNATEIRKAFLRTLITE